MIFLSLSKHKPPIFHPTNRASRKTVEDAKIFQVLEESTDSDV
jgi:hypothetical protein